MGDRARPNVRYACLQYTNLLGIEQVTLIKINLINFFFNRWKGENVSTNEIEDVISNILKLKDVIVYGVEVRIFFFLIRRDLKRRQFLDSRHRGKSWNGCDRGRGQKVRYGMVG